MFKPKDEWEDLLQRYPSQVSGGEKQRLSILRALAGKPSLIVADEPFSRLDIESKLKIVSSLKKAQRIGDFSCLISTHDLLVAAILCDEVFVLEVNNDKHVSRISSSIKLERNKNNVVSWAISGDSCSEFCEEIKDEMNFIIQTLFDHPTDDQRKETNCQAQILH